MVNVDPLALLPCFSLLWRQNADHFGKVFLFLPKHSRQVIRSAFSSWNSVKWCWRECIEAKQFSLSCRHNGALQRKPLPASIMEASIMASFPRPGARRDEWWVEGCAVNMWALSVRSSGAVEGITRQYGFLGSLSELHSFAIALWTDILKQIT